MIPLLSCCVPVHRHITNHELIPFHTPFILAGEGLLLHIMADAWRLLTRSQTLHPFLALSLSEMQLQWSTPASKFLGDTPAFMLSSTRGNDSPVMIPTTLLVLIKDEWMHLVIIKRQAIHLWALCPLHKGVKWSLSRLGSTWCLLEALIMPKVTGRVRQDAR